MMGPVQWSEIYQPVSRRPPFPWGLPAKAWAWWGGLNLACPWGPQAPLTGDLGSRAPYRPCQIYLEPQHSPLVCVCLVTQWCLTLCDPMDRSLPSFFVHVISQARILEWIAISSSRGSSPPRDRTAGRYFVPVPPGSPTLYSFFFSSFPEVRCIGGSPSPSQLLLHFPPSCFCRQLFLHIHPIMASASPSSFFLFFKKNIWVY